MKKCVLFLAILMCMLLLNVSCKEENYYCIDQESDPASLAVTISGENTKEIRSYDGRAVGIVSQAEENKIFNYTVYVFFPTGVLETSETVSGEELTKIVTGLTPGSKKVVVLANVPENFGSITKYSELEDVLINLDTQAPVNLSTKGLAMSGENSVMLESGNTNQITVPIARIVSKIKLGGIIIDPAPGHDPDKFELIAVHIMKAAANVNMGIPTIISNGVFYGGITGTVSSTSKTYLTELISSGNENCYFYLFPNDNSSGNATLFTIEGKYNNETTFFSFRINDKVISANDGTGEYIKRNTIHTIHVTLKKLGGGTTDPEVPADPTDLEVIIVPEDWYVIPDQSVEW